MGLFRKEKEEIKIDETEFSPKIQQSEPSSEKRGEYGSDSEQSAASSKDDRLSEGSGHKHAKIPISPPVHDKSDVYEQIEDIMEEGMGDVYAELDPYIKKEFKKRGEETATLIERLVVTAKVTAQRVFQLILSWLKIIPHVNKYYLQQEAKIKADKILQLSQERETVKTQKQ